MEQALFWTIIGTGAAIIGLIYAMIRNLRSDIKEDFNRLDSHLTNRIDNLEDHFTNRIDSLAGKVTTMDSRLIEVEKHLFAIRTIINYDPDGFRKEK